MAILLIKRLGRKGRVVNLKKKAEAFRQRDRSRDFGADSDVPFGKVAEQFE